MKQQRARNLTVIPARGGSKRIPRKNIRQICGKPLIEWTYETLSTMKELGDIIVSTDDQEIANICRKLGISVPFLRPQHLSTDYSTTLDVARHTVQWHQNYQGELDRLIVVYPTAIFLKQSDLLSALKLSEKKNYDIVFSACAYEHPIQRGFKANNDGTLSAMDPNSIHMRTQDLQKYFFDAGQFYVYRPPSLDTDISPINGNNGFVELKKGSFVDIDDEDDLILAEKLMMRLY